MRTLAPRPIDRQAFAPFGDLVSTAGVAPRLINGGTTQRFHDLAKVEILGEGGHALVSIFRGRPFALPLEIRMLERHPLGSQAFMPLSPLPWLAVVAPDAGGRPGDPVAFLVKPGDDGLVGVNYRAGVWHHPLIALEAVCDFLVVDRGGEGNNLEEFFLDEPWRVVAPAA